MHKIKLNQMNYGFRKKSENVIKVHCAVIMISASIVNANVLHLLQHHNHTVNC